MARAVLVSLNDWSLSDQIFDVDPRSASLKKTAKFSPMLS